MADWPRGVKMVAFDPSPSAAAGSILISEVRLALPGLLDRMPYRQ